MRKLRITHHASRERKIANWRGGAPSFAMNFREKIVPWSQLDPWRQAWRDHGQKLVVTNGCFDILHLGHVTYLEAARNLGDMVLIGVSGDDSVQQLKGANRPV